MGLNVVNYALSKQQAEKAASEMAIIISENATSYIGITTTKITDGMTERLIIIDGKETYAEKGNIVAYGANEYMFDGSKWIEFGDKIETSVTNENLVLGYL
jgi:hypothetical protein